MDKVFNVNQVKDVQTVNHSAVELKNGKYGGWLEQKQTQIPIAFIGIVLEKKNIRTWKACKKIDYQNESNELEANKERGTIRRC